MGKISSERQKHRNAMARARMAKMRDIMNKDPSERTAQEQATIQRAEENRRRKNERARQRLQENQERIDRILATPAEMRSRVDQEFLEKSMSTRERKITCDRDRRKTLSLVGTSTLRDAELMGIPVPKTTSPQILPQVLDVNRRAAEYLAKVSNSRKENRGEKEMARGHITADDRRIGAPNSNANQPPLSFGPSSYRYPMPFPPAYGGNESSYTAFVPSGPPAWAALNYPYPPPSAPHVDLVWEEKATHGNIESV
jgi:hypothetical protein